MITHGLHVAGYISDINASIRRNFCSIVDDFSFSKILLDAIKIESNTCDLFAYYQEISRQKFPFFAFMLLLLFWHHQPYDTDVIQLFEANFRSIDRSIDGLLRCHQFSMKVLFLWIMMERRGMTIFFSFWLLSLKAIGGSGYHLLLSIMNRTAKVSIFL